jgi:hypothetical protein
MSSFDTKLRKILHVGNLTPPLWIGVIEIKHWMMENYTGCDISQLIENAAITLYTNFSAHRCRDYYINYLKYDHRQNVQRLTDLCRTLYIKDHWNGGFTVLC